MARKVVHANEAFASLIRKTGSSDKVEQLAALDELADLASADFNYKMGYTDVNSAEGKAVKEAQALVVTPQSPIQEGIMAGDIVGDIFETQMLGWDEQASYPMDMITPGSEGDYVAYTMPNTGRIPNRFVEGDEVTVNTYRIANSIDWDVRYSRSGRIDVVSRAMKVLQDGIVKKNNDDGMHTIEAAGLDRGIMVYDSAATAGVFTKKLLQLMAIQMKRAGGGNTTSDNQFVLTDLLVSPEAIQDIFNWSSTDISEVNRTAIENSTKQKVFELFGVRLHELSELGQNQEYTKYFTSDLSGSLAGTDVELVIGLDLSKQGVFVNPVRGAGVEVTADDSLLRSGHLGVYSSLELSWACLDSRAILLGSF